MSKLTPVAAVLNYLWEQNRPYSANDIVMNLHKEHGKAAVQKALDQLVIESKIAEKVNGKQKAYVVKQDDMPSATDAQLAALDGEVASAQTALKSRTEELRAKEARLKQLTATPTTAEAKVQLEAIEADARDLKERLDKLAAGQSNVVTKEDKARIERRHECAVKEWRARKRMCVGVLDAILESYPKSKKALYEEVGIDTDEEAGAKIPDI